MLVRSSRRYVLRHPWLTALAVVGVALGVAVVVAVDLANASSTRAFALSSESVTGRATHEVVGGADGFSASVYQELRAQPGFPEAAPIVEGWARAAGDSARVFQILGVDPLAEAPFRPFLGGGSGVDLPAMLTVEGAALLSTGTAEALGVGLGGTIPLAVEGRVVQARVAGLLDPDDARSRSALQNLLVVDLSTAQAWLGMAEPRATGGRLSRMDLLVPAGPAGDRLLARVAGAVPDGVTVRPASARAAALATMTAAFRTNLTALSLLALVVGVFLIYNTVTFSVVQRRRLIGTYRALGVTRGETFALILGEALAAGVVGTVLGLALGVVLGQGLVRLVTGTIGDLYFAVRVRELALSPLALAKGAALGLGASVLAALRPAYEATTAPPSAALRRSTEEVGLGQHAGRLALAGLGLALAGGALLLVPSGVALAYVALLLVIGGAALAAPWATRGYALLVAPLAGRLFGAVGTMAARGIAASLSRTAVAVASLAVAVSATIGVGVMVQSFRETVVDWLTSTLQADVFISPPALVFRRGDGLIDSTLVRDLAALPGVAAAYPIRVHPVETEGSSGETLGGTVDLFATAFDTRGLTVYRFKQGDPLAAFRALQTGGAIVVSEPLAFRFGVGEGDSLRLRTDRGLRAFRIAGVYYDYGSDLGVVQMDLSTYARHFDTVGVSGVALYAEAGVEPDVLVARAQALAEGRQALQIRSNRALREASIAIFDRTFVVTSVLRLLAVGVAFVGVLSALMALQLERRRELAVFRAQGMTPGEVGRMVTIQTGLLGLWAGLLSVPLGLVLAAVLVFVINRRSFGWTLAFTVSPAILLQAVALALAAAVLAGLYPAWAMSRTDPSEALREDG